MLKFQAIPKVEIVPYDPKWSRIFEDGSDQIHDALGSNCVKIHHIGSTSVPGLAAKPIIDVIPAVTDILEVDIPTAKRKMEKIGYMSRGENGIPFRRFFRKNSSTDPATRLFNVHVYQDQSPEIEHRIAFREYLRSNHEMAWRYVNIKQSIAKKYPKDMDAYCLEKSKFFTEIGNAINFNGRLLRHCWNEREWKEFARFLNKTKGFIPGLNEFHFVFYRGISNIIGAAYLDSKLETIEFQIEETEHESEFHDLLELWKEHQRIQSRY